MNRVAVAVGCAGLGTDVVRPELYELVLEDVGCGFSDIYLRDDAEIFEVGFDCIDLLFEFLDACAVAIIRRWTLDCSGVLVTTSELATPTAGTWTGGWSCGTFAESFELGGQSCELSLESLCFGQSQICGINRL